MLGLATRLAVAEQTLAQLHSDGRPEAGLIDANRPWFMLGALGPALGDFVPFEQPAGFGASGRTPYYNAWKLVLEIAVGDPTQSPPLPGAVPTLRTLLQTLQQLTQLVQAHDFDGVVALRDSGALDAVNRANDDLAMILQNFSQIGKLQQIGDTIGTSSRPRIDDPMTVATPNRWTGRDYLHWKRPGDFGATLLSEALSSGDDRFVAYAYGWLVSVSTLVGGASFLASIVGSVYRTHWWRTRYVANFVDTWVWGYYHRAGAAADEYDAWPSLCNARLQEWIDVGGSFDAETAATAVVTDDKLPSVLPAEFLDFWTNAWTSTYAGHDTTVGTDPLFTKNRLQAAYAMTWLVLWFQTSGAVIGCNPTPGVPPDACGDNPQPPDWNDPTQVNPVTGQPFTPPTPNAHHDPNVGEVVCGVILGLLGVVATAFGGGAIGIPLITGGIALAVDGEKQLNWDELECQLYWLSVYVFNGLGALHKLTVLGGFQQPYAAELAAATARVSFNGLSYSFPTAADDMCRSREVRGPLQIWNGGILDWTSFPSTTPIEAPAQFIWERSIWPSAIVDDTAANPATASILDPPAGFDAQVQGSFGPAVQNAARLIAVRPDRIPNWNLDGDRGHGWLTWELHASYAVPVQPFPEA